MENQICPISCWLLLNYFKVTSLKIDKLFQNNKQKLDDGVVGNVFESNPFPEMSDILKKQVYSNIQYT